MRLLAQVVAERIAERMVANFGELDQRVIADIAQQRDQLLASANKVIVFLFTTITIIAIVLFGAAEEKVPFFGITITQPDVFAFIGFMVGNVAYVVSTGLFFKLFVCEFLILCITKSPIYSDNRDIGAFVHCYHANSLSYLVLYDLVPERMWVLRRFLAIINLYSKYYVLIAYGLYYYTVLGFFFARLWQEEKHEFLWPLVVANVMSIFTSYAVFYVVGGSESLAREAAVEPAASRNDRPAELALAESDTEPFRNR